eukprot:gnl/Hemi2/1075_TR387_c0_g1_i1.p1 gnl/Hemi2/1075_TR387_c0_g1~~gnl/Hemi2/1075_TR387_c0_g1_i1.p1  ORF type:complete len:770 (+),score=246.94 gnl/Hemi2/1075_TR387_c0_g1_i1:47-2356(+)
MSAGCIHSAGRLTVPHVRNTVQKEECTLCFKNQDDEYGVDVCLHCLNCSCEQHSTDHAQKTSHMLVLNIKRFVKENTSEPPQKITRLAIGGEGGASLEGPEYEYVTSVRCAFCGPVTAETASPTGNVFEVVAAVMAAPSQSTADEIKAWSLERKPCRHTQNLQQNADAPQLADKSLAHCGNCALDKNLWLCLTCGNLGCARSQGFGLGGNGHGLAHFEATRHPVSIQMGTITPEGGADVHCYVCDEEVTDPSLAQHLATFGLDILKQQKTIRSMVEMELDQNLNLDLTKTVEDGKTYQPVFGPGLTGINNLGNSCYMASVLQSVFASAPFQNTYVALGHQRTCRERHNECFHCQMEKMARGLLDGTFSRPQPDAKEGDLRGQIGVSPRMFRHLIGRDHVEFETMKQQDALEYYQHLLKIVERQEKPYGRDPGEAYKFTLQQRLQCLQCLGVRYQQVKQSELFLNILRPPTTEGEAPVVRLEDCLAQFMAPVVVDDFRCPACNAGTQATIKFSVETTPDILVLALRRFVYEAWVPTKLDTNLNIPESLNLEAFVADRAPQDEHFLPAAAETSSAPAEAPLDMEIVNQLMNMGFPQVRCEKAVRAGNKNADAALGWLMEHMEDPDIDVPVAKPSAAGAKAVDPAKVSQLMEMGVSAAQARKALKETDGNVERAVDWMFSHDLTAITDEDEGAPSAAAAAPAGRPAPAGPVGNPHYRLKAFITHRGTSVHCGHYVAHVRQADGTWVLFNDNKVVVYPDPPVGRGYMYFFERV